VGEDEFASVVEVMDCESKGSRQAMLTASNPSAVAACFIDSDKDGTACEATVNIGCGAKFNEIFEIEVCIHSYYYLNN